jgi:hypothetical protein
MSIFVHGGRDEDLPFTARARTLPLSPLDVATAENLQRAAAQDTQSAVRLVAGPGTGKSASVEERFCWLYADQQSHPPHEDFLELIRPVASTVGRSQRIPIFRPWSNFSPTRAKARLALATTSRSGRGRVQRPTQYRIVS